MVEGLHDIVGDEGHGWPELGVLVISGKPQSQIELKARAFGQSIGNLGLAVPLQGDQDFAALTGCVVKPEY